MRIYYQITASGIPWIILLSTLYLFNSSSYAFGQVGCYGQPTTWYGITSGWPHGPRTIGVRIFSTANQADRSAIDTGIRDWNSVSMVGCAQITFGGAVAAEPSETPGNTENTIYVIRGPQGSFINGAEWFPEYVGTLSSRRVKCGRIGIEDWITHTHSVANYLKSVATHEAGHSLALDNVFLPSNYHLSVMGSVRTGPTCCDNGAIGRIYCPTSPTPVPCFSPNATPTPLEGCYVPPDHEAYPLTGCATGFSSVGGYCDRDAEYKNSCAGPSGYDLYSCSCPDGFEPTPEPTPEPCGGMFPDVCDGGYGWSWDTCQCEPSSPVLIDISGNGFFLTNSLNGVNFDLNSDGTAERISWTAVEAENAWLTLDNNRNGQIDDGTELFGNFTAQPEPQSSQERNGFLALGVFDRPNNGGNGDGIISSDDTIFPHLKLWKDSNHNGVSERDELFTLSQLGLVSIHLDYKMSKKTDEHGNQFRWRAKVDGEKKTRLGRWAWDVILRTQ